MTAAVEASTDPRYCNAKKRQGDGFCTRPAGWGTEHVGTGKCKLHGGRSETHNIAARGVAAAAAVTKFGLPRVVDPHTALLEELHRSAGVVAFLEQQTQRLDSSEMHAPVGGGENSHARREASVWIRMLGEERDRLRQVAKTCVDVGIEERRVRVVEQGAEQIGTMLLGVLDDLGMAADPRVPEVVRRRMMAIEAPSA